MLGSSDEGLRTGVGMMIAPGGVVQYDLDTNRDIGIDLASLWLVGAVGDSAVLSYLGYE